MSEIEFDQIRLDVLREITSIATGNAATSLSALLGRKVDVTVPNIMVESVEKVPEILGGGGRIASVVYFLISGKISGSILLVLSSPESLRLANLLTGQKVDKMENLDEMGLSALKELGNIIIGSYMRVLADELKVRITHSVPGFAYDMLGAVLDELLAQMSLKTEYAVIMESEFIVREEVRRGHLVFILEPETTKAIIRALGT
ncbi:MAG: chemotaxis protein CheC [Thermodesulfobacteriota bacterium]